MFLILKDTDWKEEDYIKHNIVPSAGMKITTELYLVAMKYSRRFKQRNKETFCLKN